jgi:hypothetical protein
MKKNLPIRQILPKAFVKSMFQVTDFAEEDQMVWKPLVYCESGF